MSNFNLAAPPNFRGLHANLPISRYERHLPHWRQEGATYFVTFRLADALPQSLLQFLHRLRDEWVRTHQMPRSDADCVVMANHCHAVIQPWIGHELEDLLQGVKSMTARAIHRANGTAGSLWQQESYDRIVRDEEHLWRVVQYIGHNPRNAGLAPNQALRWIHPDWEAAGWRFIDD